MTLTNEEPQDVIALTHARSGATASDDEDDTDDESVVSTRPYGPGRQIAFARRAAGGTPAPTNGN